MKTYEVTIERIGYESVTVEARDEEHAEELAWKQYTGTADDCVSNSVFHIEEVENE